MNADLQKSDIFEVAFIILELFDAIRNEWEDLGLVVRERLFYLTDRPVFKDKQTVMITLIKLREGAQFIGTVVGREEKQEFLSFNTREEPQFRHNATHRKRKLES